MAERKPPSWEHIRSVIERIDEICRESERTREEIERSMRRRPVWPERGQSRTDEPDHHSSGSHASPAV